jgi:hypothetical protein
MANPGKLKLHLTNVDGKPLREDVNLELRHLTRGTDQRVRIKAGKQTTVTNLHAQPDGVYRVLIDPPSYLPVSQFVSIKPSGVTELALTFPVDPGKVKKLDPPDYDDLAEDARRVLESSDGVLLFEGKFGEALYDAIDDIRLGGLLNIVAKTGATAFASGRSVLSYITRLTELRGDRFFAVVPKELREETKNAVHSGLFQEVDGSLHHPPKDFTRAGSYKTLDHYGNLQLTFFAKDDEWRADIDIDDAAGLEHVFQVLRNHLTNNATHPFAIRELLVHHQKLDPGYELLV